MSKSTLSLKEIQEEEAKILGETIKFLNKNNIKYTVFGGTFLGTIRHKGFIPWDDDIDIALPRLEYNKLLNILGQNKNINDELFATSYELSNSVLPFLKIVNKNIVLEKEDNYENNLWIDIFPLDAVPSKFTNLYFFKVRFMQIVLGLKRRDINKCSIKGNFLKRFLKRLAILLLKPFPYKFLMKKYLKLCSKYNFEDSKLVANVMWGVGKREILDKSKISYKKYKFENLTVNGLEDYDYYLSKVYGDYMTLPPIEKRYTHGFKARRIEND